MNPGTELPVYELSKPALNRSMNHMIKGIEFNGSLDGLNSPYVNSVEEMLSFDTSLMNKCLSDFLDSITNEYLNDAI